MVPYFLSLSTETFVMDRVSFTSDLQSIYRYQCTPFRGVDLLGWVEFTHSEFVVQ